MKVESQPRIVVGGVWLTQSQLDILSRRQITLEMLQDAAHNATIEQMRNYIYCLLDTHGGQDEAAGPGIDCNFGNQY